MNLEMVQIVASSCAVLFDTVQTVRTNRTQTRMMLERVHQIVRALINLCGDAQRNGEGGPGVGLAPGMARAIEIFTETLTTMHTVLQEQASAGLFSRIIRNAEMKGQLADCDEGLQHALDVFSVKTGLLTHAALGGARKSSKDRHEEIVAALKGKGFGVDGEEHREGRGWRKESERHHTQYHGPGTTTRSRPCIAGFFDARRDRTQRVLLPLVFNPYLSFSQGHHPPNPIDRDVDFTLPHLGQGGVGVPLGGLRLGRGTVMRLFLDFQIAETLGWFKDCSVGKAVEAKIDEIYKVIEHEALDNYGQNQVHCI
ncbi:hypothetical protein MVEN_01481100 [Mycena venus]|uniref:Uncharacterized protein n=1 Tax=Mycena venus TaxID=2733690 RepID=A0A8H7CR94_9AGAR|nr:hypothetical protein MVEN_01481100 [Mycena venus]